MTNENASRVYTETEVVSLMQQYGKVREIATARAGLVSQGLDPEDTEIPVSRDVYNRHVGLIPESIRNKLELKLL